jgi:hypothetical protein
MKDRFGSVFYTITLRSSEDSVRLATLPTFELCEAVTHSGHASVIAIQTPSAADLASSLRIISTRADILPTIFSAKLSF